MKQLYSLTIALLFISVGVYANEVDRFKHEKTKSIKKEYTVNANALLKINNKYGNVDIISWNGNKVIIEVKITVSGNSENNVIERLKKINIEFEASQNEVSAKTLIDNKSSSWSWPFGGNKNIRYQIDYKVKVPITNNVNLNNDYGSITLNELKGNATINCDYGKIIIGELLGVDNKINIDYCNSSTIGTINGGSINADYSKFTVENAGNILLDADYTSSVFENIKSLNFDCDYGGLKVLNGTSVFGDGDYLTVKIGEISENVKVELKYGSIKIESLLDGFKLVDISSKYTGVKIGVPKNDSFNFELNMKYGSFKHDKENYDFTKQIIKSSSKYYKGYFISQSSISTIKVNSGYGSVTFY